MCSSVRIKRHYIVLFTSNYEKKLIQTSNIFHCVDTEIHAKEGVVGVGVDVDVDVVMVGYC